MERQHLADGGTEEPKPKRIRRKRTDEDRVQTIVSEISALSPPGFRLLVEAMASLDPDSLDLFNQRWVAAYGDGAEAQ